MAQQLLYRDLNTGQMGDLASGPWTGLEDQVAGMNPEIMERLPRISPGGAPDIGVPPVQGPRQPVAPIQPGDPAIYPWHPPIRPTSPSSSIPGELYTGGRRMTDVGGPVDDDRGDFIGNPPTTRPQQYEPYEPRDWNRVGTLNDSSTPGAYYTGGQRVAGLVTPGTSYRYPDVEEPSIEERHSGTPNVDQSIRDLNNVRGSYPSAQYNYDIPRGNFNAPSGGRPNAVYRNGVLQNSIPAPPPPLQNQAPPLGYYPQRTGPSGYVDLAQGPSGPPANYITGPGGGPMVNYTPLGY